MSEQAFKDWFTETVSHYGWHKDCQQAANLAWDHQQKRVDELITELVDLHECVRQWYTLKDQSKKDPPKDTEK